jgi:hypothetical protein
MPCVRHEEAGTDREWPDVARPARSLGGVPRAMLVKQGTSSCEGPGRDYNAG